MKNILELRARASYAPLDPRTQTNPGHRRVYLSFSCSQTFPLSPSPQSTTAGDSDVDVSGSAVAISGSGGGASQGAVVGGGVEVGA